MLQHDGGAACLYILIRMDGNDNSVGCCQVHMDHRGSSMSGKFSVAGHSAPWTILFQPANYHNNSQWLCPYRDWCLSPFACMVQWIVGRGSQRSCSNFFTIRTHHCRSHIRYTGLVVSHQIHRRWFSHISLTLVSTLQFHFNSHKASMAWLFDGQFTCHDGCTLQHCL